MTTYGPTPTGFVTKTQAQILAEIEQDELDTINPQLDVSDAQPIGQLNGVMAAKLAEVWTALGVAYNSFNRQAATGAQLDAVGAFGGTIREGATPTTVFCEFGFSVAGTYAPGSLVTFLPTNNAIRFSNQDAITVPSTVDGSPIGPSNPYNSTGIWQATVVGPDTGNALIAANEAANIPWGSLTGMVPVTGWMFIADEAGPTLGTLVETDTAYRIRQQQEIAAAGSGSLYAIAARIEQALAEAPSPVSGVTVTPYENTTDLTDAYGLPPHSFMMVVFDGLTPDTVQNDPIIGQTIWDNKPAGIAPYGSTSVVVVDAEGNGQTVFFSRTTQVQVFMAVIVAILATADPDAVKDAIVQAIVDASQGSPFFMFGQQVTPTVGAPTTLEPGVDVVLSAFKAVAQGQSGVVDVPAFAIGLAPSPTGTSNLPMNRTQVGVIQPANIVVVPQVFVP